jgi:putative copper export protein/mono/diheme cytochrome c family protein
MSALFVAVRAIHYGSAMLLLGELVFAFGVARPVFRPARIGDDGDDFHGQFFAVAWWGLVATIASGVAWFAAEAVVMSGLPIEQAMTRGTLSLILADTAFGHIFALRLGLVVALGAVFMVMRRLNDDAGRSRLAIVGVAVAAAYLGSLAWVGHAVPGDESEGLARIAADVAHLLAAGAWLGALPALVFVLGRARAQTAAARMARRFSTLGLTSVGVLIASGLVNAWYQVGDIPALVGTDYGRLLAAKLALFAAMLGLATVNRGVSTRPVSGEDRDALRLLRRNAMLEIAFGIGVIAIVGALGVTVPAAHQPPIWPFDSTLSFDSIQQSAWMQLVVVVTGAIACVAAVALVAGALSRPPHVRIVAVAGLVIPVGILALLLAVPAYPTTYLASPVRYTAEAIATGSTLYAASCGACHGRDGRGEGSTTLSLPRVRLDLNERVPERREGDVFWSIAHGVPGTPMPGFASQMSDREIWSLIQFLDAQTAAQNALAMSDRLKPLRSVPAPDFTYELTGRPQESLWQRRGNRVTLLVFYTLPSSLPRLLELATLESVYAAAGARVIALPMPASSAASALDMRGNGESMLALASPAVATAYTMFARRAQGANGAPAHLEYLIDRFGYLRVRWIGVPEAAAGRSAETLRQIDVLVHEPQRAAVQWGHRH